MLYVNPPHDNGAGRQYKCACLCLMESVFSYCSEVCGLRTAGLLIILFEFFLYNFEVIFVSLYSAFLLILDVFG